MPVDLSAPIYAQYQRARKRADEAMKRGDTLTRRMFEDIIIQEEEEEKLGVPPQEEKKPSPAKS